MIVPIGFFLAIMLALGRLYHESEMAAIQSCGVGPAGLFRPIALLGVVIAALLVWLSFWAIPEASARAQQIRAEALRDAQFGSLAPGRFRTFGNGNVVFYAERVDEHGILYNVNVFVDHTQEPTATKAGSRSGSRRVPSSVAPVSRSRLFVLYDGERYEGVPGSGEFRIIQFSEGGFPIRLGELSATASKAEMKSTRELLRFERSA